MPLIQNTPIDARREMLHLAPTQSSLTCSVPLMQSLLSFSGLDATVRRVVRMTSNIVSKSKDVISVSQKRLPLRLVERQPLP
jgi:hypothetical protein